MKLPDKHLIISWQHSPTIYRLMSENRWAQNYAAQWFTDFMRWLYTAIRSELENNKNFTMDNIHYLDDVWHAYILHTKDYMQMSQELFDCQIIHHTPENPFVANKIADSVIIYQMEMLIDDWGDEYVDRVWQYGADMHDIIQSLESD